MAYKPKLLTLAESGTGAALTASNGGILYSNASTAAVLAGTATAGQVLRSGSNTTPSWSTATYPATAGTSGNVLTSDGTNWTSSTPAAGLGYTFFMQTLNGSPLDGGVYFPALNNTFINHTTSNSTMQIFYIPKAGTVTACVGSFLVAGTLGSNENCTLAIRLNNTSDTTVSSTIQLTAASVPFSNTGMSLAVVAGDYIELKFTSPTWGTNPTNVSLNCAIYVS